VPCRASCAAGCSCASRLRGVAQTAHSMCRFAIAAIPCRDPAGFSREGCDARHRERRRDPRIHASLHSLEVWKWKALASLWPRGRMPPIRAPEVRRGCEGIVRSRAHTMCARSLNAHATAWMPEVEQRMEQLPDARKARRRGGLLLGYFFLATQEEVTRSLSRERKLCSHSQALASRIVMNLANAVTGLT
jgi:hypothetical protein